MKMKVVGALTGLLAALSSTQASADFTCVPDIKISGFSNPPGDRIDYVMGTFDLLGTWVMGVCVNGTSGGSTMYLVTTMSDYPLPGLPYTFSSMCLTSEKDFFR